MPIVTMLSSMLVIQIPKYSEAFPVNSRGVSATVGDDGISSNSPASIITPPTVDHRLNQASRQPATCNNYLIGAEN